MQKEEQTHKLRQNVSQTNLDISRQDVFHDRKNEITLNDGNILSDCRINHGIK